MPTRKYTVTIYSYLCETQVSNDVPVEFLEDCEGSEEFRDKEDAEKQGWQEEPDGKVWCKICFRKHNKNMLNKE